MEQARIREENQMKADHAKRLKLMRLVLEDEQRKRVEESARVRRQLELKQVRTAQAMQHAQAFNATLCHAKHDEPTGCQSLLMPEPSQPATQTQCSGCRRSILLYASALLVMSKEGCTTASGGELPPWAARAA